MKMIVSEKKKKIEKEKKGGKEERQIEKKRKKEKKRERWCPLDSARQKRSTEDDTYLLEHNKDCNSRKEKIKDSACQL